MTTPTSNILYVCNGDNARAPLAAACTDVAHRDATPRHHVDDRLGGDRDR